jgi:hypothetical protein
MKSTPLNIRVNAEGRRLIAVVERLQKLVWQKKQNGDIEYG